MKKLTPIIVTGALVGAAYFIGLQQRPSYEQLPLRAQEAITLEHQDANERLSGAVNLFKIGQPTEAQTLFERVKEQAGTLRKIDPNYGALEDRMFQYGAAIIDTGNLVGKYLDPLEKNIVNKSPQAIAAYVRDIPLHFMDKQLETIGPESGAYHRLEPDVAAQEALLEYYANGITRWCDLQERMITTIENVIEPNDDIIFSRKILAERKDEIERDRAFIKTFKSKLKKE